jgi:predicted AlkP superfamily pyrophosphatase or phosphodiesterase
MLNTKSLDTVNNAKFSQRFIKPLYDSYCFCNIPQTIEFLLTGKGQSALPLDVFADLPTRYDKVILFFIDAFGWCFLERYADRYEFLKTLLTQGVISKMTSQFPSTTAAHVTCTHTGLNVGQSGVYEWHYYEPLVDELISPLLFSYATDRFTKDTLKSTGIAADVFYPRQTFYRRLQTQGIASHIFQYEGYTPSTYSEAVFHGATPHAFKTLPQALSQLSELVTAQNPTPSYYFLYFDRIDAVGHQQGPNSKEFEQTVDTFLKTMDSLFYRELRGKVGNTLFMMTADHGQMEVNPRTTYYLNKQIPTIERYLKTTGKGRPLVPAGSARDMFLYIKEEHMDEAIAILQAHLTGKAEIYRTQDLLAEHFFGLEEPSPTFLGRLGNVVILPYKNETVWWYEEGIFTMHFRGHHGGLAPEEMEIPLLVLPL